MTLFYFLSFLFIALRQNGNSAKHNLFKGVIGMSGRGKASFELPGWRAFIEEKLEEERDL